MTLPRYPSVPSKNSCPHRLLSHDVPILVTPPYFSVLHPCLKSRSSSGQSSTRLGDPSTLTGLVRGVSLTPGHSSWVWTGPSWDLFDVSEGLGVTGVDISSRDLRCSGTDTHPFAHYTHFRTRTVTTSDGPRVSRQERRREDSGRVLELCGSTSNPCGRDRRTGHSVRGDEIRTRRNPCLVRGGGD